MALCAQTVLLDLITGTTEAGLEPSTDSDTNIATASSSTSKGLELQFWFRKLNLGDGIVLLRLHASNLETPNPYGGSYGNRYFAEAMCTHKSLVVIRLSSPRVEYPTDYFVYGCSAGDNRKPWVERLPEIVPEIISCNSVGVLCADDDNGDYVVANLRFQVIRVEFNSCN
jgi:hypothetical protein